MLYTKVPKHYTVLEVLNNSMLNFCFEFYSNKNDQDILIKLNELTKQSLSYNDYDKENSLIKEFDAPLSKYKLNLSYNDYHSFEYVFNDLCEWLNKNTITRYDTSLRFSIGFNKQLNTVNNISTIQPYKLLFNLDEEFIYSRFPNRKNSSYSVNPIRYSSVKFFINESNVSSNFNNIFESPRLRYNSVDFSDSNLNLVNYNFIGGKNYLENSKNIKDVLEYLIIKTYQAINENEITNKELYKFKILTQNYGTLQESYFNANKFLENYKDIKVYINLKLNKQSLITYWDKIRETIFECISNSKLQKGIINYDTATNKLQFKSLSLNNVKIKNADFVNCNLSGVFENCDFMNNKISSSVIRNSSMLSNNHINLSVLENVTCNSSNVLNECEVNNEEEIISCKVFESIIKYATPGDKLKLDEKSIFIIKRETPKEFDTSLKIDGIRDYSWIKSMRSNIKY